MDQQREVMEAAVEAGHILLENGAEIFRVEETIKRICHYYGVKSSNVFTMSNGIFVTAGSDEEQYFARVQQSPVSGSHLDRVAAVNQLSREIEEGKYTIGQVRERLEEIRNMPGKSNRVQIFAAGMGSAAFSYIYGGSPWDSLAAFFAGVVLYVYVLYVSKPHMSKIVSSISGGALATLVCILLHKLQVGDSLNHMVIGAVIPMVPGVAFTNAIRDIGDENYISGAVRMLDALLVFFCIAMGVGLVFSIYQRITGGTIL